MSWSTLQMSSGVVTFLLTQLAIILWLTSQPFTEVYSTLVTLGFRNCTATEQAGVWKANWPLGLGGCARASFTENHKGQARTRGCRKLSEDYFTLVSSPTCISLVLVASKTKPLTEQVTKERSTEASWFTVLGLQWSWPSC